MTATAEPPSRRSAATHEPGRLPPLRSIAKDTGSGNVGEIMHYLPTGSLNPSTAVLRPEGGGLEWRTDIGSLVPLNGWPGRTG